MDGIHVRARQSKFRIKSIARIVIVYYAVQDYERLVKVVRFLAEEHHVQDIQRSWVKLAAMRVCGQLRHQGIAL